MCPTAGDHGRLSLPSQSLPAGTARCCRVLRLPGPETGRGAGRFGEPSMGPGGQRRLPAWGTVPRPAALSSQGAGSHGVHVLISAGRASPEVSPDGVAGGRGRGYPGGGAWRPWPLHAGAASRAEPAELANRGSEQSRGLSPQGLVGVGVLSWALGRWTCRSWLPKKGFGPPRRTGFQGRPRHEAVG